MTKKEFERKMSAVYPEKDIRFEHNEVQNAAHVDGFIFLNDNLAEAICMFWKSNGSYAGRAYGVEEITL